MPSSGGDRSSGPGAAGAAVRGVPPAPWHCKMRAICLLTRCGVRPAVLAAVVYESTPVGAYHEVLVATYARPFGARVPWIVVDSAASALAGQMLWALPKEMRAVRVDPGDRRSTVRVEGDAAFELSASAGGPSVPIVVPGVLRQPGRKPAALVFTGRARLAAVTVAGTLPFGLARGSRRGVLLDGRIRIGRPGRAPLL